MWRDYSADLLKNNRFAGLSVRLSAFISALLLSLLCGLFYNTWKYEIERIELEEGGWQSRIMGELDREDIEAIKNFANVKEVAVKEKGDRGEEPWADIYFDDMSAVFSDTPHIAELVGVPPEKVVYNYQLLAMYLIRSEGDRAPRLVFPMFILITALASFSLIMIIHNAFAVSMNGRIHQFGIFSGIGATPRQIRACLLQEAAALCALPAAAGNLLGIGGSMGLTAMSNVLLGSDIPGRHQAVPGYHPLVLILTLIVTVITIWISAWLPARKLSRLTPLEAIKNTGELQLKRRKNSRLLSRLFGVEGELAGCALKAQRKALRTASLSLSVSFMAFALMECFFALSGISTRETYFRKYQGAWDVMVTVKDAQVDAFGETEAVQGLAGAESAIVYQKAAAKRIITEEEMSEEMKSFGGFSHAPEGLAAPVDGGRLVNAPIVILDDNSFASYCRHIGAAPRLDGTVILNQIRDVTNPDFRHPDFMPYIKEESAVSVLIGADSGETPGYASGPGGEKEDRTAKIPVLAYTREVPVLREEYATLDYYELVHFIPASLWREIKGQIGGAQHDIYICVLGRENGSLEDINQLQDEIDRLVGGTYVTESENRMEEQEINDRQIHGMMAVFGGFCVLLGIIGIGNVFSNALGFARQRKREFARYMSVGMTPKELRNMFCIEGTVLALRPIFISLPLVIAAVWCLLKMSYLEVEVFLAEAPFPPILLFMLAIVGAVALAYALAWQNIRKISLAEVLRDDTLM